MSERIEEDIWLNRCNRCGYKWTSRTESPGTCANKDCRSPYWNKPRVLARTWKKDFQKRVTPKEKPKTSLLFESIDIVLEVTNTKNMLTHHTWTWNLINVSKKPLDYLFYSIGGDIPRSLSEMNFKITDKNKNQLENLRIELDRPLEKEFGVKLKNPLKTHQKGTYKMEYDWEEPDRSFTYKVNADCKSFTYKLLIPKEVEIKNEILKINEEFGYKWSAYPSPTLKFLKDSTSVTWIGKNLNAFDIYRFDW